MNISEIAKLLNGRQYRDEVTPEIAQSAKDNGIVIAFGASDDLLEFRGAVYDEVGSWDGTTVYISAKGNIKEKPKAGRLKVESIWAPKNEEGKVYASWLIKVDAEHETFEIFDEDGLYCIGAVFHLPKQ